MEKEVSIPTPSGHIIYGTLNYSGKKPTVVMVIVHGLTGNILEHPYFTASRYFPKHSIATFRVSLYDWRPKSRRLVDSTIRTHALDVNTVVNYLNKSFSKIFLAGHSYGGPSILFANHENVDGLILWDSSDGKFTKKKKFQRKYKWIKQLGFYIDHAGITYGMGKPMLKESQKLERDLLKHLKTIVVPTQFIYAGKGLLVKNAKHLMSKVNAPKELVIIPNATHCFPEEGADSELFRKTLHFIQKYS